MLSIENPPPDPSCSYQFPLLNSNSDERASASDHKPVAEEVDLPNSDLDHHTPLPNFSIRDYVFTSRSKDIKKNWPFSLKNLQLCLKHGVKELLPPLKPLDKVSKKSLKRCMVGTSLAEKEKTGNHEVVDTNSDDPQLNVKIVESCLDISSCRSGDENDFPSTTTSLSHSEIESLTVNNKLSTSQTETHPGTLAADESAGPSRNNKTTENTSGPLSKKCRLIVKFGGNFDRSSTEDIVSNSATVSEIMASKVCPVCKTFSSSSNTTLNAHIDQCLSVMSTPNWTSDSKLTRHRIKPRKTRLMVDIYTTALPCTLEELDRRNGTTWATVSCLPRQEIEKTGNAETINEGKKMRVSHIHPEDIGDVGPVYIDANGTKLRILSNFDDQPLVSKLGEDIEARKRRKGDKEGKYILKKKKKRLAQKHHKFLNLAPKNKMNFFQKARGSQEEEWKGEAKICEKDHIVSKRTKPSDAVTLRPWFCFKRRGFTKKTCQEGQLPVRCNWHLPQDLLAYNGQSFLGETLMERNVVQKFANLSENPISSAKNDRTKKSFQKVLVREKREQSPRRKRMGKLLVPVKPCENLGHLPVNLNSAQSENCGTLMTRPSNSTWNHSSLLRKRNFEACGAANISDISCIASTKSSGEDNAIPSVGMEFSLRKYMLRVSGRSSVTESVCGEVEKFSALEKSQLHSTKKRNKDEVTKEDREYDLMGGNPENLEEREYESFAMNTVLEPRQGRGILCVSQGEGRLAMRTESPSPHFYDHDVLVSADSSAGDGDDFLQKVDCLDSTGNQVHVYAEDVAIQPSSNTSDERSVACTIKSIDSEFYEFSDSSLARNSSLARPNFLLSVEDYRRVLCGTEAPLASTEPDFVNDRDMFSADEGVAGQDSRIAAELDSVAGHEQSFREVGPILIPGPPGSFLPSPRDMGSEDFQGNASFTTSRVHSSLDQHDPVDGDSLDSPMSAASTISNSTAERHNFKYSEPSSSAGPYDRMRSTAASVESSLQSVDAVSQASGAEVEGTAFHGGYLKLDRIYVDKGSLSFKNDQPCCCQRKERLSQAVALNFQESQLLRRTKMASMTIPAGGKRIDFNSNLRSVNLDVTSEFVPPSSCPDLGSEKMVLPITNPLCGTISFKDSPNPVGVNFLARADPGFASPSASNPVLRLMGKNLLVVNKDEDTSVPVGGVQSHIQNKTQTSHFLAFSEVSSHNIHNYDSLIGSQASVIFGQSSHKPTSQFYDGGLSNSFRLPVNAQLPAGMFQGQQTDYGFAAPAEYHELKGDSNISSGHIIFKNRPNADGMEKIMKAPECCFQHVDSPQNPVKEIITVDDVSESKNIMIGSAAKYAEGGRECPVNVSPGIPIPTASQYDPNRVHPLSCYQSQAHDHPLAVESVTGRTADYHATPSKLGDTCPVRWSCTSEGSGVLQRSPFTASSYSPGHIRSTALHYMPGFT